MSRESRISDGLSVKERMAVPEYAAGAKVRLRGKDYDIPLTESVLSKHILFSGSIGSGKTTAMNGLMDSIIRQMTADDVMIVFDTKGDFRRKFYRAGKDAVLGCDSTANVVWNMFSEVTIDGADTKDPHDLEKIRLNLMELLNSLFDERIRRSHSPFFPMAAKDVLYGIMTFIMHTLPPGVWSNQELYYYLRDATLEDVVTGLSSIPDLCGILDYICLYTDSGPEFNEQTQGVYSELRSVANELLISKFGEKGNFSVRRFVRNKGARILFVEYDISIGSVLTPIYKAIFDLAIKETLSRGKSAGNVYFVIDEFSLLPHLYHIADGVNFGRSLGAKFIVAIQNVMQIIENYGRENAYSILSAFGTLVSFRASDGETIRMIQDHYGTVRRQASLASRSFDARATETLITGKTVEDWDILSLGTGEAIVSVSEYGPSPAQFRFKNI